MTFTNRFTSFAARPSLVSGFSRNRTTSDGAGTGAPLAKLPNLKTACPFCCKLVDVRSGIPVSDPYFALHADADGTCEGSCLLTSIERHSNRNQTTPGTAASADRPQAMHFQTELSMSRFPTRAKPEERSQSRAYFELWGQVDFLAPRVLAALPATHPAAAAFTAFKSTQDNLPDEIEMPAQLLNAAMQAYRDLSDEERHTVMNGWTVDADFTSHAALKFGVEAVQIALNCCTLEIDGNRSRCTAFDDAIGGDSHQAPLTLHILAGTSYADTMRALDQAREMIDSCWRYIISGHFITGADGKFVTDTAIEKKSGRTAADARLPGQLPSTNAAELTAPMNPDDTGNDLAKSITELRDWAAALVA